MLGSDGPPAGLEFAWEWPRLDDGALRAIEAWLKKHPAARLIVIDTLKRVRPHERAHSRLYDADYDSLAPLTDLAHRYSVTVLVIHHTRKADSDDPLDLISGSTGLTGAAGGALVLRRARGRAEATLHAVCRDLEEDKEIALRWDSRLSGWRILGAAAEVRQSKEREAVKQVLRKSTEGLTPKAVAEIMGRPYPATKKLLWTMAQDGDLRGR